MCSVYFVFSVLWMRDAPFVHRRIMQILMTFLGCRLFVYGSLSYLQPAFNWFRHTNAQNLSERNAAQFFKARIEQILQTKKSHSKNGKCNFFGINKSKCKSIITGSRASRKNTPINCAMWWLSLRPPWDSHYSFSKNNKCERVRIWRCVCAARGQKSHALEWPIIELRLQ